MKSLVCVLLALAVVAAEPPQYQFQRYRFQRREVESDREPTTPKPEDAPYPPAGIRPTKEFNLPARVSVSPPATSYGVPANSYGVPLHTLYTLPRTEFGPGKGEGRAKEEPTEVVMKAEEIPVAAEKKEDDVEMLKVEGLKPEEDKKKEEEPEKKENIEMGVDKDDDVITEQGNYYILLPDASLQKVQFRTQNDLTKMAYTAKIQYQNENAPVYVYGAVPEVAVPEYAVLPEYAAVVPEYASSSSYFQLYV